jgi:hypothetical protein
MGSEIAARRKPEEEELAKKRAELARLEAELGERELALASFRAELAAFEGRYLRAVGVLYAELDDINAQIAERIAQQLGSQQATQDATEARQRAQESYAAAHGETAGAPEFAPTAELKSLYREVAKKVHPDLTSDPADRNIREKMMAEANRAYERGDADALRRILEEYEGSPDAVQGTGVAADLVRVIRKITQARNRLAQIEEAIAQLRSSEIAELMARAEEYRKQGRDLLAELAEGVRKQIAASRQRLASL